MPVQSSLLELLSSSGVLSTNHLHRAAADRDALALAEARRELLQVVATEPLVLVSNRLGACLVAEVENLIDLACHLNKRAGVLVFDAQLQSLDRFQQYTVRGVYIESKNSSHKSYVTTPNYNRLYQPVR